jgi:arabinosyltransferase C
VPLALPAESDGDGEWTELVLGSTTYLPAGATRVRIQAIDRNYTEDGWVGLTDPYRVDGQTLRDLLQGESVVLDWPVGLNMPCIDPPRIADGMVEPVEWLVLSGAYADAEQLTVIDERGGSYSTMSTVAKETDYRGFTPGVMPGYTEWGRLVRWDLELPADRYRLVKDHRTIAGWKWWPGAGDGPSPDA